MKNAPARRIFIYCEDPGHSKRVAVSNFKPLWSEDTPDDPNAGRWGEYSASRARPLGTAGSGVTLDGNDPLSDGGVLPRDVTREYRSRYALECRKCKTHPVQAVEEKLFAVLTALWEADHREVPLSLMREGLARVTRA